MAKIEDTKLMAPLDTLEGLQSLTWNDMRLLSHGGNILANHFAILRTRELPGMRSRRGATTASGSESKQVIDEMLRIPSWTPILQHWFSLITHPGTRTSWNSPGKRRKPNLTVAAIAQVLLDVFVLMYGPRSNGAAAGRSLEFEARTMGESDALVFINAQRRKWGMAYEFTPKMLEDTPEPEESTPPSVLEDIPTPSGSASTAVTSISVTLPATEKNARKRNRVEDSPSPSSASANSSPLSSPAPSLQSLLTPSSIPTPPPSGTTTPTIEQHSRQTHSASAEPVETPKDIDFRHEIKRRAIGSSRTEISVGGPSTSVQLAGAKVNDPAQAKVHRAKQSFDPAQTSMRAGKGYWGSTGRHLPPKPWKPKPMRPKPFVSNDPRRSIAGLPPKPPSPVVPTPQDIRTIITSLPPKPHNPAVTLPTSDNDLRTMGDSVTKVGGGLANSETHRALSDAGIPEEMMIVGSKEPSMEEAELASLSLSPSAPTPRVPITGVDARATSGTHQPSTAMEEPMQSIKRKHSMEDVSPTEAASASPPLKWARTSHRKDVGAGRSVERAPRLSPPPMPSFKALPKTLKFSKVKKVAPELKAETVQAANMDIAGTDQSVMSAVKPQAQKSRTHRSSVPDVGADPANAVPSIIPTTTPQPYDYAHRPELSHSYSYDPWNMDSPRPGIGSQIALEPAPNMSDNPKAFGAGFPAHDKVNVSQEKMSVDLSTPLVTPTTGRRRKTRFSARVEPADGMPTSLASPHELAPAHAQAASSPPLVPDVSPTTSGHAAVAAVAPVLSSAEIALLFAEVGPSVPLPPSSAQSHEAARTGAPAGASSGSGYLLPPRMRSKALNATGANQDPQLTRSNTPTASVAVPELLNSSTATIVTEQHGQAMGPEAAPVDASGGTTAESTISLYKRARMSHLFSATVGPASAPNNTMFVGHILLPEHVVDPRVFQDLYPAPPIFLKPFSSHPTLPPWPVEAQKSSLSFDLLEKKLARPRGRRKVTGGDVVEQVKRETLNDAALKRIKAEVKGTGAMKGKPLKVKAPSKATIKAQLAIVASGKPSLPRLPLVWACTRQELCQATPYFRSFQGGVYSHKGSARGYLLGGFGAARDAFLEGGKLIISHGGGKNSSSKPIVPGETGNREQRGPATSQASSDISVRALVTAKEARTPVALVIDDQFAHFPFALRYSPSSFSPSCGPNTSGDISLTYAVLGWYTIEEYWAEKQVGGDLHGEGERFGEITRFKFAFRWCEGQGVPWWIIPTDVDTRDQSVIDLVVPVLHKTPIQPQAPSAAQPPNPQPADLSHLFQSCTICCNESPRVYRDAWCCLQAKCPKFWIMPPITKVPEHWIHDPSSAPASMIDIIIRAQWSPMRQALSLSPEFVFQIMHRSPIEASKLVPIQPGCPLSSPGDFVPDVAVEEKISGNPSDDRLEEETNVGEDEDDSNGQLDAGPNDESDHHHHDKLPIIAEPESQENYAHTRGFFCPTPGCGRLNCRIEWTRWVCENCGNVLDIPHPVISAHTLYPRPGGANGTKVDGIWKDWRHAKPWSLIAVEDITVETYELPTVTANVFTFPYNRGKVYQIRSVASDVSSANGATKDEADDIFKQYQAQTNSGQILFKRWPMRAHKCKGALLTNYFSQNSGVTYNYVGGTDNTIPLEGGPPAILEARAYIKRQIAALDAVYPLFAPRSDAVGISLAHSPEFNEILTAAYHPQQSMSWHSDAERGLGHVVAGLSLGGGAIMSFREHMNSVRLRGKLAGTDDPRGAAFRKDTFTKSGKAMRPPMLKVLLQHGDVLVMHGHDIQQYYEHCVEPMPPPIGCPNGQPTLRIAATARWISEGQSQPLVAHELNPAAVKEQPYVHDVKLEDLEKLESLDELDNVEAPLSNDH